MRTLHFFKVCDITNRFPTQPKLNFISVTITERVPVCYQQINGGRNLSWSKVQMWRSRRRAHMKLTMCERPIISLQNARPHNIPFLWLSDPPAAWAHLTICSLSNISKATFFGRHFWSQYRYSLSEPQGAAGPWVNFRGGSSLCHSGSPHSNRPVSVNCGPQARPCPPPAFVNYTCLEHSHIVHLCMIYDSSQTTTAEFSSCNRNHTAPKAKNIYYMTLYRKSVPTPDTSLASMAATRLGQLLVEPAC